MREKSKLQSALELLITYSWAFLIIALFVVVVFIISFSKPPTYYLGSSCNIQPEFPCTEALVTGWSSTHEITYYVLFMNQLGTPIELVPSAGINLSTDNLGTLGQNYSVGTCLPLVASVGAQVLCKVVIGGSNEPPIGSRINSYFRLNYYLCKAVNVSTCATSSKYVSTGYSLETIANSTVNLDSLTLNSNVISGHVFLNGISYTGGTSILLFSGTYTAYGQAPYGYKFQNWVGNSVVIANVFAQNTTVTFNLNGSLSANFICSVSSVCLTATSTTTTILPLGQPSLLPSNPAIDNGQSASFTSTWSGGTPTYTANIFSSSTPACNAGSPLIQDISGLTSGSASFSPVSPVSNTYYCAYVTDSEVTHVTTNSMNSEVVVSPALSSLALAPTNPSIIYGQQQLLTATWAGGTSTYSIVWYSGPSSTCSADSTVIATASNLLLATNAVSVSPASSTYYCVQVTDSSSTPANIVSSTDYVTVLGPTVTAISPNNGINTGSVSITSITGTNFASGATANLIMTGQSNIVCTGFTFTSSTTLSSGTCPITGAATGAWNVVVTNPNGQFGTLTGGFTVLPPAPTVTAINPNTGPNSGPVSITSITGTNFISGATANLIMTGQSNIVCTGFTFTSSTTLSSGTCPITGAVAGAWSVVVTNPTGQAGTLAGGFTVTLALQYVPITLSNSQSSAISANFQQLVNVTSNTYSSYITTNWSNVEFTAGAPFGMPGNVPLYAWVESGAVNNAAKTMVWLNLGSNTIGAAGSGSNTLTIFMNFLASNSPVTSGYTGYAPQLWCASGCFQTKYAQYDNGAQVFMNYWNFIGGSLPSGWINTDGVTSTVSNGVTVPATSSGASWNRGGIIYQTTNFYNTNYVFDSYFKPTDSGGDSEPLIYRESSVSTTDTYPAVYMLLSNSKWKVQTSSGTYGTYGNGCAVSGMNVIFSYYVNGGSGWSTVNYGTALCGYITSTASYNPATQYIGFGGGSGSATSVVTWIRTRALPPSGAMPSASFGTFV